MIRHLYLHIPFCPKICPYCSFFKEASTRNKTRAFLDAVLAEAERSAARLRPRTVFFGGGTPTALSTTQLDYLLAGLQARLDFSSVREWTFEMNPATVSAEKAQRLLQFGVNRFSMGVQSWDPALLQTLGRVHSADQARRSLEILRESGCRNVNLDLIFGIPGQTLGQWEDTLHRTALLEPEHISAYCLTYEEDTAFFNLLGSGIFRADEELEREMFLCTRSILAGYGYEAYEISNFAKAGKRCLHNLAYWRGADYLGLGPSAFSTLGQKRWRNVRDTARYIRSTLEDRTETDFQETVGPQMRHSERLAFALRTAEGIPAKWIAPATERRLVQYGLLEAHGTRRRLTGEGILVADAVAGELLDDCAPADPGRPPSKISPRKSDSAASH